MRRPWVLLALNLISLHNLVTSSDGATSALPRVPRQTPWQRELFSSVSENAARLSREAEGPLLELLDSKGFRSALQGCCASISTLPAVDLLRRLQEEIRISEIISGFPAEHSPAGDFGWWNTNLAQEYQSYFFQNNWQVRVLHNDSFAQGGWFRKQDDAEVLIYGLKPFSRRGWPADFSEASERGPYCIVNHARADAGSLLYGDVSAVFDVERVRSTALVSAVDTGQFEGMCNSSSQVGSRPHSEQSPSPLAHNCLAYPASTDSLGTLDHFNHLLVINNAYWNGIENGPLVSLFARLVAEPEARLTQWGKGFHLKPTDLIHYLEVIPAGSMLFPSDVKFIIGKFPSLFGTQAGAELQAWCLNRSWPLVWSLGPNVEDQLGDEGLNFFSAPFLHGTFPSNQRLLDPRVLASNPSRLNVSVAGESLAAFTDVWLQAQQARAEAALAGSTVSGVRWASLFAGLRERLPATLGLEPLRARSCADEESCIGTDMATGRCVCSASPAPEALIV